MPRYFGHYAFWSTQHVFGLEASEEIKYTGNESGPAGLVARSETCAVVSVEVLIEEDVVLPVRIVLELPGSSVDGAFSVGVTQEHAGIPTTDLSRYFKQRHVIAGARRAFDLEVRAVERMHLQQAADDET